MTAAWILLAFVAWVAAVVFTVSVVHGATLAERKPGGRS